MMKQNETKNGHIGKNIYYMVEERKKRGKGVKRGVERKQGKSVKRCVEKRQGKGGVEQEEKDKYILNI